MELRRRQLAELEEVIKELRGSLLAQVSRDVGAVRGLESALTRLAQGTYGVCIDCNGEIDFERLLAHPVALRCFDCQEARERTSSHLAEPKP